MSSPHCTLCQRTFAEHIDENLACPGNFLGDIEPTFGQMVRFSLRHPLVSFRATLRSYQTEAWNFRHTVAESIQKSCEASFSLEHSRMVREQVLTMSWLRFAAFVAVMLGAAIPFRVLEGLGLSRAGTRLAKWFQGGEE